ncbi:hypothetical protein [Bartonella sp. A05]|uniref:hypothetical protein n=1 Tax=Bartonella sp. A05 TaxID=2967261 RepID=UPI0022A9ABEA|nr:hypothetical protein [Bartonella sp. A05]MCZ2203980.1 hypothetical protein [Bartonella sp. A05]
MKSIFYLVLGVFLLLEAGRQSFASEPASVQRIELSNLVVDINDAVKKGDFAIISTHMPDQLYKEIARRLNTTEVDLRKSFLEQLRAQFKNFSIDSYHLDETKIDYRQTDKGTFYALIPTRLETKDRVIQYKTLAIVDNDKWYLIYGGQKTVQNPVFLEIYPDLNGINLPAETIVKK